jgi:hypothetical protein
MRLQMLQVPRARRRWNVKHYMIIVALVAFLMVTTNINFTGTKGIWFGFTRLGWDVLAGLYYEPQAKQYQFVVWKNVHRMDVLIGVSRDDFGNWTCQTNYNAAN